MQQAIIEFVSVKTTVYGGCVGKADDSKESRLQIGKIM